MTISGIGRFLLGLAIAILSVVQLARVARWSWTVTSVALVIGVPVILVLMYSRQRKTEAKEQELASGSASKVVVRSQKASPAKMKLIAACLFVIACFATVPPYKMLCTVVYTQDEQAWPSVTGKIQTARVESTRSKGRAYWYPVWSYSYVVDGTPYSAGNRDLQGRFAIASFNSEVSAIAAAALRPIGADITVFYDPSAPQHSVLDRRTMSPLDWEFTLLTLLFPMIPLGAAAVLYGASLRN
jgi:hypothetical protein